MKMRQLMKQQTYKMLRQQQLRPCLLCKVSGKMNLKMDEDVSKHLRQLNLIQVTKASDSSRVMNDDEMAQSVSILKWQVNHLMIRHRRRWLLMPNLSDLPMLRQMQVIQQLKMQLRAIQVPLDKWQLLTHWPMWNHRWIHSQSRWPQ